MRAGKSAPCNMGLLELQGVVVDSVDVEPSLRARAASYGGTDRRERFGAASLSLADARAKFSGPGRRATRRCFWPSQLLVGFGFGLIASLLASLVVGGSAWRRGDEGGPSSLTNGTSFDVVIVGAGPASL